MGRRDSEWTILTLKELHEQRFAAMDQALELKSVELSRRLDILNHAHEKAVEVQHTYVPREVYEADVAALAKQFQDYKEATNRALLLREGQTTGLKAVWVYFLGAIAAAGTLVSLILVFVR